MTQPNKPIKPDGVELDSIQRDIWAGINDVLQERGVKLGIGDAYSAGSSIKETLHPRVRQLLAEARYDELEKTRWMLQKLNPKETLANAYMVLNDRSNELSEQLEGFVGDTSPAHPKSGAEDSQQ